MRDLLIGRHQMNKIFIVFLINICTGIVYAQPQTKVVQYVQTLIGTGKSTTPAALKHSSGTELLANTIPAVTVPFAMTQWTAQTQIVETKCIAPYYYQDSLFYGFRGSHWLSGSCTQDYGSFTIMPITGKLKIKLSDIAVPLLHDQEIAQPFYYSLQLPQYALKTEITATPRSAIMQITSNKNDSLHILIRPNSDRGKGFIKIDRPKNEISGYNPVYRIYQGAGQPSGFSGYFVIQADRLFSESGTYHDNEIAFLDSLSNQADLGAFISFQVKKESVLKLKIGTSFTSIEEARKNLEAEIPHWNFEMVKNASEKVWENALDQIKVEGDSERDKTIFYTALYHSMQHPRVFNDLSGTYPAFSKSYINARLTKGNYYDDFSMWDIYRAQLPLLEILKPELVNDFVSSLILKGQQGGWLPIFPCWNNYTNAMIGDHAISFIASAYMKGIADYDSEEAYRLMRKNAFEVASDEEYKNGKGRRALNSYLEYQYIPLEDKVPDAFHKQEQVSRTLEYAYDDYALAMMAKKLNKETDYKQLIARSQNYRNVFDDSSKLVRGRYADGRWFAPFNPDIKLPFITEGTSRQYTFYVPHDIPGLADLMGGKKQFENALDTLFLKGEYWHGNEPGHQIPFLYNFTESPWKTQQIVNKILSEEYADGPGGLSGNDDAGQMSAWYVFAAMGFYPVDPVSGNYLLTSPVFDKITIRLAENKTFVIHVKKQSSSSTYIHAMKWNGELYQNNFLTYTMLKNGGTMEFELGDQPH